MTRASFSLHQARRHRSICPRPGRGITASNASIGSIGSIGITASAIPSPRYPHSHCARLRGALLGRHSVEAIRERARPLAQARAVCNYHLFTPCHPPARLPLPPHLPCRPLPLPCQLRLYLHQASLLLREDPARNHLSTPSVRRTTNCKLRLSLPPLTAHHINPRTLGRFTTLILTRTRARFLRRTEGFLQPVIRGSGTLRPAQNLPIRNNIGTSVRPRSILRRLSAHYHITREVITPLNRRSSIPVRLLQARMAGWVGCGVTLERATWEGP
jgi:hypothetical protein